MARILVIDDAQQVRDDIRLILEREGYAGDDACDGYEGVRFFSETRPTLSLRYPYAGMGGVQTIWS